MNQVFKIKSQQSTNYMTNNLLQHVHTYGTRFRENGYLSTPKVKGLDKTLFAYNGGTLWNNISNNIKEIHQAPHAFKKAVKTVLDRIT